MAASLFFRGRGGKPEWRAGREPHKNKASRCRGQGVTVLAGSMRAAVVTCGIAAVSLWSGDARAAGAAYAVDTADVSEPGACKVESWMSAAANHDFFAATSPTCVVNLFRPVELSTQLSRARADGEWSSGAIPKFKTN